MNQIELDLINLKMRLVIVERLLMKTHLFACVLNGSSLEAAAQATIHSISIDDELVQRVFAGLDPGEVAIREMELREVIEQMQACVLQIAEQIRIQSSSD